MDDLSLEIRQLEGCLNDLLSLVALPTVWERDQPESVLTTLLDVLVGMLGLDLVYGRFDVSGGLAPLEAVRVPGRREGSALLREVREAMSPWLAVNAPPTARAVPDPLGGGEVSIARFGVGVSRELGVVVAAASRPQFPTAVESLLLRVAMNQAALELQRAELLVEQQRAVAIQRAKDQLEAENSYLRQERDSEQHWGEIVGHSKPLRAVLKLVEQVAPTRACVLIQGETGTGKELVARAIHQRSPRKGQAFVKLNCAAIPTGLLESELFGHEKGAFTGAVSRKSGRFELADGGTIFLDEVGEIPLELQPKLLRVLQEREFERLGGTTTIQVDVRLVAASNRDLAQMVTDGEFRSDLYYRLKVFPILVPPLRERAEDIPLLVRCFTARHALDCGKSITTIPSETMRALCDYHWPGNIREIENFIERSVILSAGAELDAPLAELTGAGAEKPDDADTLKGVERQHIIAALQASHWVIAGAAGAAAKLGIKRTSLQYKIQKLGILRPARS